MKYHTRIALELLDSACLAISYPLFILALLTAPAWVGGLLQWWKS